jgi:hypothetical protein
MIFGGTRSLTFGLLLAATPVGAGIALGQPQPPAQPGAPISAEERATAEKAVLSDPRIRAIVGAEQLRVASGDVEVDKAEAESFLAGTSERPPGRRVTIVAFNMRTNKAARAVVALPQNQVLAVEPAVPTDMPLVRDDADQALALAKTSPELRRAVGDSLDRYAIVEPGSDERVPFAAQALPLRNSNPKDPCSVDRCLTLILRTENGYLALHAQVDLTKRTVSVQRGAQP